MQTAPATPMGADLVGWGIGQPGQVKPTTDSFVNQTTTVPVSQGRQITVRPGAWHFDDPAERSIGLLGFNTRVLDVKSNLIYDSPHPGTTGTVNNPGNPLTGATQPVGVSAVLRGGGRPGPELVSFCVGASNFGNLSTNFNNHCLGPADGDFNGLARFTKTKNQFGGTSVGRVKGTAGVYLNSANLILGVDVPCAGTGCTVAFSKVIPQSQGVGGGVFGGSAMNPAFQTPTGWFTASVGFNGTVHTVGDPVKTTGGINNIPYTGQAATSVGFPSTTGMLTISVTGVIGTIFEIFQRTGTDARDADGNGVIGLVSGTISAREITLGNANPGWTTMEIPEPSAIFAASAGLFALFGCHQLVRRRSR